MDAATRAKILTRRITIHKSEIPRGKAQSTIGLQKHQFIGQDLFGLEFCFENQMDFNAHTVKHFKWKYTMCHLYFSYYKFLIDYPVFEYSGISWSTIRNSCTRWRRWLDSTEAISLPISA